MDLKSLRKKESATPSLDVQKTLTVEQAPVPETQAVVETVKPVVEAPSVSEPSISEASPVVQESIGAPSRTPPIQKMPLRVDKLELEIEDVLEEDLSDLYLSLSQEKQAEFKIKGEETRSLIRQLALHAHKNAKKIFELIRTWLKLIPGVNRFFLEQEAKIKTDKILMVADEEQRRGSKETL